MIAIFDLDGTLALNEHRQHFLEEKPKNWKAFNAACGEDEPNWPVIGLWHALNNDFRYIVSGRSEEVKFDTVEWLHKYGIKGWHGLAMRGKNDHRDDTIVKKALFRMLSHEFHKTYNLNITTQNIVIFDDRQKVVDMWREMGLTCCHVAPGDF